MLIKKLEVRNFKSFRHIDVELRDFNVLIGPNASGKSNFVQIFKFLRDIAELGLENAVSMQGGVEYLRNMSLNSSENLSIKIVLDVDFGIALGKESLVGIKPYEVVYKFVLGFYKRGLGFRILEDRLELKNKIMKLSKVKRGRLEEKEELGKGRMVISAGRSGRLNVELHHDVKSLSLKEEDIIPFFLREKPPGKRTLLLQVGFPWFLDAWFSLRDVSIYDFDPKLPKKAVPITGKYKLEGDGSNLAIVLKNIILNKEKRRKFLNLIKELLPFIKDVGIEKFADKSLLLKLQEAYSPGKYLPASIISDGTINSVALLIALYFERSSASPIIIEEIERNIHPALISKVVNMMKDTARNKQIIVTTHNPEVVKHAGLENLFLVSRDEDGFSTISRPADKEEVKVFLKNDMGIEELYVLDLL